LASGPDGNQNGTWFSYARREAGGQLLMTVQSIGALASNAATIGLALSGSASRINPDGISIAGPDATVPKVGRYFKTKGEKRMEGLDLNGKRPSADGMGDGPDYSAQMAALGLTPESVREHLARSRAVTADLRGPDTTPRPQI
ncbi:MAG: hypothetical protein AAF556_08535, partial [Pseudomonadota bacterium]